MQTNPPSSHSASTAMRLQNFPVSFFSVIMGLTGFIIALRAVFEAEITSPLFWVVLPWIPTALFIVIAFIYAQKCIRCFPSVRAEFDHPVKLSFFPTVSISLILLSIAFLKVNVELSYYLCGFGALLHLIFTIVTLGKWVEQNHFKIEHINPSWFIPIVGNILVPISSSRHFHPDVSWFFFSIGSIFWIQLATVLLYRKIFHTPIPERLSPTFFILIAPPALGFISYTSMVGAVDGIARVFLFFGLFTTIFVMYLARKFIKIRFYLSFWAYSFPLAAITVAVSKYHHLTQQLWAKWVAQGLFTLLTVLIIYLFIRTIVAIKKHEICNADH